MAARWLWWPYEWRRGGPMMVAIGWSGTRSALSGGSGEVPGAVGSGGESEVEESLQVDGSAAMGPAEPVAFDAAEAQSPVGSSGEPGQAALDHGPLVSVDPGELDGGRLFPSGGEELVVRVQGDGPSVLGGGAQRSELEALTVPCEGRPPVAQFDGRAGGAGHGGVVGGDLEVVEGEPAGHGRA